MTALAFYTLISTAFFFLGSRALITRWLWKHYPPKFAAFMDCAACSGFWYGLITSAIVGRHNNLHVFDFDGRDWSTPFIVGLSMIVLVPILGGVMQRGFDSLGSITQELEE